MRALLAGNDLLCIGGELPKYGDVEAVVEAVIAHSDPSLTEGRDQVTVTVADEPFGNETDATESYTGGYDY